VTKLQWNKDEALQQMLILHHFHVAGHQVSGAANVVALEIEVFFYMK
jgi:hypothetical protein